MIYDDGNDDLKGIDLLLAIFSESTIVFAVYEW